MLRCRFETQRRRTEDPCVRRALRTSIVRRIGRTEHFVGLRGPRLLPQLRVCHTWPLRAPGGRIQAKHRRAAPRRHRRQQGARSWLQVRRLRLSSTRGLTPRSSANAPRQASLAALRPRSSCLRAAKPSCRGPRLNSNVSPRVPPIALVLLASAALRSAPPPPRRFAIGECPRSTRSGSEVGTRGPRTRSASAAQFRCTGPHVQSLTVATRATPAARFRRAFVQRRDGVCPVVAVARSGRQNLSTTSPCRSSSAQSLAGSSRAVSPRHLAAFAWQPRANLSFKRRRPTAGQLGRAAAQVIVLPRGQAALPRVAA